MKFVGIKNRDLVFEINDVNGEYIIGRADNCDIIMNVKGVSSQHCRLYIRDNQYALIDLGSSNGTLVNGTRIKRKMLHPKDIVQLGVEKFNVILPAEAQEIARRREKLTEEGKQKEVAVKEPTPEESQKQAAVKKTRKPISKKERKAPQKSKPDSFVKPEETIAKDSSVLWLIIFFVGGLLGIALFVVGLIMKSASDAKIQELQNSITEMKQDRTTNQSKYKVLNDKLSELQDNMSEFKSYVDDVSNKTYQSQRDVSTEIEDFKKSLTDFNERISETQMKLAETQKSIDEVNQK